MQFTTYPPDSVGYNWHCDIGDSIQSQRKVSLTVNLNEDFDGGGLEFRLGTEPTPIPAKQGKVILFPSYILHRVKPIKNGTRHSLVLWAGGDHFR